MGIWRLESVNGVSSDFTTDQLFGNKLEVTFRLRYTPSIFGSFAETPKLYWHERITMKELHKGVWWEFEKNMYEHNPCSNTLKIWAGRYVHAYKSVFGVKGQVKLLSEQGMQLALADLKQGLADSAQQAEAVRSYLKKRGGILEITINDIPSINKPKGNEHKERLLRFDCGVVGGAQWFRRAQHLDVDASKPEAEWTRLVTAGQLVFSPDQGLMQTIPPGEVTRVRPAIFLSGECW